MVFIVLIAFIVSIVSIFIVWYIAHTLYAGLFLVLCVIMNNL